MREILFRGKRVDNGEWVEGSSRVANWGSDENKKSHTYEHVFILRQGVTLGTYRDDNNIQHLDCEVFDVIPETVGQYTGLKDKNGSKIFEGDIFHIGDKNIKYKVIYQDTGLIGKAIRASDCVGLSYWKDVTKVLGNIHDNPELLK